MGKMFKLLVFLYIAIISGNICSFAEVVANDVSKKAVQESAANQTYIQLKTPVMLVASPYSYFDKYVEFQAKFNKFSTLGLDYTPAKRESQKYIGILIERDDAGSSVIPLSELKMFIKRTDAEKFSDLESGDTIHIKGKVFSTALGDPWMDIIELKVLTKKEKKTDK